MFERLCHHDRVLLLIGFSGRWRGKTAFSIQPYRRQGMQVSAFVTFNRRVSSDLRSFQSDRRCPEVPDARAGIVRRENDLSRLQASIRFIQAGVCCRAYWSKFNQNNISNYAHDFFSNAVGAPAGPRFLKRRYSIFASASNEPFYCFILFYSLNFYERGFRKEDSFLLPASVFWHFLLYQIFNARTMPGGWRGDRTYPWT